MAHRTILDSNHTRARDNKPCAQRRQAATNWRPSLPLATNSRSALVGCASSRPPSSSPPARARSSSPPATPPLSHRQPPWARAASPAARRRCAKARRVRNKGGRPSVPLATSSGGALVGCASSRARSSHARAAAMQTDPGHQGTTAGAAATMQGQGGVGERTRRGEAEPWPAEGGEGGGRPSGRVGKRRLPRTASGQRPAATHQRGRGGRTARVDGEGGWRACWRGGGGESQGWRSGIDQPTARGGERRERRSTRASSTRRKGDAAHRLELRQPRQRSRGCRSAHFTTRSADAGVDVATA